MDIDVDCKSETDVVTPDRLNVPMRCDSAGGGGSQLGGRGHHSGYQRRRKLSTAGKVRERGRKIGKSQILDTYDNIHSKRKRIQGAGRGVWLLHTDQIVRALRRAVRRVHNDIMSSYHSIDRAAVDLIRSNFLSSVFKLRTVMKMLFGPDTFLLPVFWISFSVSPFLLKLQLTSGSSVAVNLHAAWCTYVRTGLCLDGRN